MTYPISAPVRKTPSSSGFQKGHYHLIPMDMDVIFPTKLSDLSGETNV